jgi:hypothetical protein
MCIGMANGGKTKVDKVENFIRETNEWHRVAELNANEIIRLQAENDRLNNELHSKVEYIHEQLEIIESKKVEIERLTNIIDDGAGVCHNCHLKYAEKIEQAKSEAIKEFEVKIHEKLHEAEMHGNFEPVVNREMFDSVVKEMVGEQK